MADRVLIVGFYTLGMLAATLLVLYGVRGLPFWFHVRGFVVAYGLVGAMTGLIAVILSA